MSSTNIRMPSAKTLHQSAKLSIENNKPICYYFYNDSLVDEVAIVPYQGDKIIYKNKDEHTSPIVKTYKCDSEYIVITENSIYIISAETKIRKNN